MKNALAYVSLHRSEGYGLTISEAMELGTPVIATGYSGNMDFMNETNSLLVDYDLIEVKDSAGAYVVKSRWADPRIRSAAGHMRSTFEDLIFAKKIGLAGKSAVKNNFELSRTAHFIYKRVKSIKRSSNPFSPKKIVKTLRQKIGRFLPRRLKDFVRQQILRLN
jgi:glycosyltransferase involved in cell wall biosynthesis